MIPYDTNFCDIDLRMYLFWQMVNVVRYAIWYHLHNLKNVKNTYGGVLILVKLTIATPEQGAKYVQC